MSSAQVFDKFYNTPATKSFHWPGRILASEGALANWLTTVSRDECVLVVDQAFAQSDWVTALGGADVVVRREPHLSDLQAALAELSGAKPVWVVAVGGGATLDLAKALCAHLRFGTHAIRDRAREPMSPLLVAAPTTAGSGSETSRFFILSDDAGTKISMRSWSIVPDLTILDPDLLRGASPQRLLLGAFDACIHLWETYIARGEGSDFNATLTQTWLPRILAHLPAITASRSLPATALLDLMTASAMAGIAISNVRTGLLHTLGESLAAHVGMAHPMTLRVFLRPGIESYAGAIAERVRPLWLIADALAPQSAAWSTAGFIDAWESAFAQLGLDEDIADALAGVSPEAVCATAARDTTLAKENPVTIGPDELLVLASRALSAWPQPSIRRAVNAR